MSLQTAAGAGPWTRPIGSEYARSAVSGLRYAVCCVVWVALFALTLGLLSDLIGKHVLPRSAGEGYGTYVAVVGFLVLMPVGLLLSSIALAAWKRAWVFLLLALVLAALTALAPVVVS